MQKLGTTATILIAILALAVAALMGALIATAATDDEPSAMTSSSISTLPGTDGGNDGARDRDDPPLPKDVADRVAAAALAATGGGQVTEVSYSDDPGETWEVEVMTRDRGEVDVALDSKLRRVPNEPYED